MPDTFLHGCYLDCLHVAGYSSRLSKLCTAYILWYALASHGFLISIKSTDVCAVKQHTVASVNDVCRNRNLQHLHCVTYNIPHCVLVCNYGVITVKTENIKYCCPKFSANIVLSSHPSAFDNFIINMKACLSTLKNCKACLLKVSLVPNVQHSGCCYSSMGGG